MEPTDDPPNATRIKALGNPPDLADFGSGGIGRCRFLLPAAFYFQQNPEQLPDWAARSELGRDLQTTTVYRWQDASGAWHISDRKPEESVDYREERYSRDANVLPLPPQLQQ
jgi:hypothetical protein